MLRRDAATRELTEQADREARQHAVERAALAEAQLAEALEK